MQKSGFLAMRLKYDMIDTFADTDPLRLHVTGFEKDPSCEATLKKMFPKSVEIIIPRRKKSTQIMG